MADVENDAEGDRRDGVVVMVERVREEETDGPVPVEETDSDSLWDPVMDGVKVRLDTVAVDETVTDGLHDGEIARVVVADKEPLNVRVGFNERVGVGDGPVAVIEGGVGEPVGVGDVVRMWLAELVNVDVRVHEAVLRVADMRDAVIVVDAVGLPVVEPLKVTPGLRLAEREAVKETEHDEEVEGETLQVRVGVRVHEREARDDAVGLGEAVSEDGDAVWKEPDSDAVEVGDGVTEVGVAVGVAVPVGLAVALRLTVQVLVSDGVRVSGAEPVRERVTVTVVEDVRDLEGVEVAVEEGVEVGLPEADGEYAKVAVVVEVNVREGERLDPGEQEQLVVGENEGDHAGD